jgi:hypothetical protein
MRKKKKKSPGSKRPKSGSLARSRRPRPRPRPVWLRLGPPTWLQNNPVWIRVIFVRSIGKTVQMRIQQKGVKKPMTISMALSRTKQRIKKSR